jgi:biopolymer transport protein ExbD
MARTFRRHRQAHPIAELNVTNLIDLGFTLLIIFMIATPLINQEQTIPVNLPVESKSTQVKPPKDTHFVAVTIDAKGNYYLDQAPVSFRDLSNRLDAFAKETKPPVIRIRGDGDIPYKKVIALMDELKKRNLSQVSFDTQTNH